MTRIRTWRAAATRRALLTLAATVAASGAWTAAGNREDTAIVATDLQHLGPFDILAASSLDPGERLIAELNCVACHAAPKEIADRLASRQAPLLGQVGRRLSPDYIRAWLADPHKVKSGAMMPNLLTGIDPPMLARMAEPLVHFLVSLGGIAKPAETEFNQADLELGRVLYHQVGCVACHAPREAPAVLLPALNPTGDQPYGEEQVLPEVIPDGAAAEVAPLGSFASTNIPSLSQFLHDPISVRPSGRMPSMNLSPDESRAIATYLIATDVQRDPAAVVQAPFTLDPAKAATGERMFAQLGCADCHRMGPERTEVKAARPMPYTGFLALKHLDKGCLAARPDPMTANYDLTDAQRQAIRTTLKNVKSLAEPLSPAASIDRTLSAMNCYACHQRDGDGGVNTARRTYFTTLGEAELGDEGRIPPPLTRVGGKLRTAWMEEVISTGAKVRPYMATRMPAWETLDAQTLASQFETVDAPCPAEQIAPMTLDEQMAADGRTLAGAVRGMSCINCHSIKGSKPSGEPAMDLITAHQRLRADWFHAYLRNPETLRPGTRMPNHWPPDQANPFPEIQGGNSDQQIDALWAYLSQGDLLTPPEGVLHEDGREILVREEPVVFRTFMKGAGARAIAIGFKEKVHLAFNAEQCRVAEIWRGAFLNASGPWAGRGGGEADPLDGDVVTCAEDFPFKSLESTGEIMMTQPSPHFRGYRLDKQSQPILEYQFEDWSIEEQPLPVARPGAPGLRRVFNVELAADKATSPGLAFIVASGRKIEITGSDQFNVDGEVVYDLRVPDSSVAKVLHYQDADHLVILLGNSNIRHVQFEVAMTW